MSLSSPDLPKKDGLSSIEPQKSIGSTNKSKLLSTQELSTIQEDRCPDCKINDLYWERVGVLGLDYNLYCRRCEKFVRSWNAY